MTELTEKQKRIKKSLAELLREKKSLRHKKITLRRIIRDYEDTYAELLEREAKLRQMDLEEFTRIEPQTFQEFIKK